MKLLLPVTHLEFHFQRFKSYGILLKLQRHHNFYLQIFFGTQNSCMIPHAPPRKKEVVVFINFCIITINDCLLPKNKSACVTTRKCIKTSCCTLFWEYASQIITFSALSSLLNKKRLNQRWLFCMRGSIIYLSAFFIVVHTNTTAPCCCFLNAFRLKTKFFLVMNDIERVLPNL